MQYAITRLPDPRAIHYWDGEGSLTEAYTLALGLPPASSRNSFIPFRLYMIFGPNARWTGTEPPKPDFWMHTIFGQPVDAPAFWPEEFIKKANSLLRFTMNSSGLAGGGIPTQAARICG